MSYADDYYDFFCGNDFRLIKIAIKNDYFHAMKVHGSLARTIDLSGGTRKIDEILLTECFKMTRIIWPVAASYIKSLKISSANSLTNLDLSALTNLEELSILNCSELKTITGLSSELKIFNAYGVKLNHVDLSQCKQLEIFNVATTSSNFRSDFTNHKFLEMFSLESINTQKKEVGHISCELSQCLNLNLININANVSSVNLNLNESINLTRLVVDCGPNSKISGLANCTKLEFCYIKDLSVINMDIPSQALIKKIEHENQNISPLDQENKLLEISNRFYRFKDSISTLRPLTDDIETIVQQNGLLRELNQYSTVMINLLSMPKSDQTLSIENDLNRMIRPINKTVTQVLRSAQIIIYMDNETEIKKIGQSNSGVITYFSSDETSLSSWLENNDHSRPKVLVAKTSDLNSMLGRKLINDAIADQERWKLNNKKLIITGDLQELSYSVIKLMIKNHNHLMKINDKNFHILQSIYNQKLHKKMMRDQQNYYHLIMETYRIINQKNHLLLLKQRDMKHITNQFMKMINWLQSVNAAYNNQQVKSQINQSAPKTDKAIEKSNHNNIPNKKDTNPTQTDLQKVAPWPIQNDPKLILGPNHSSALLKTSVFSRYKATSHAAINSSTELDKQRTKPEPEFMHPILIATESFSNTVKRILFHDTVADGDKNAIQPKPIDSDPQLITEVDNLLTTLTELKYTVDHKSKMTSSELSSIEKETVKPDSLLSSPPPQTEIDNSLTALNKLKYTVDHKSNMTSSELSSIEKETVKTDSPLSSPPPQTEIDNSLTALNELKYTVDHKSKMTSSELSSIEKETVKAKPSLSSPQLDLSEIHSAELKSIEINEPVSQKETNPEKYKVEPQELKVDSVLTSIKVLGNNLKDLLVIIKSKLSDDQTNKPLMVEPTLDVNINSLTALLPITIHDEVTLLKLVDEIIESVDKIKLNPDQQSKESVLTAAKELSDAIHKLVIIIRNEYKNKVMGSAVVNDPELTLDIEKQATALANLSVQMDASNPSRFQSQMKEFLKAAQLLTDALMLLMATAKSTVQLKHEYSSEIKNAEHIVEDTAKRIISISTELSGQNNQSEERATLSQLLTVGRDLSNAFKSLHDACLSQYKKSSIKSNSISHHSAIVHHENKEVKNNSVHFDRNNLITMLTHISDQYIRNHDLDFDANDSSDTGFTAGLFLARNEILKSFISALKSNQNMNIDVINQGLNELMKDEHLKLSLQGIVDSLKQCLCQAATVSYFKKST